MQTAALHQSSRTQTTPTTATRELLPCQAICGGCISLNGLEPMGLGLTVRLACRLCSTHAGLVLNQCALSTRDNFIVYVCLAVFGLESA